MNKKLSIIMLLSCVGNVFSMDGGGAAGGGDQIPLTFKERVTKAGQASSRKIRELASKSSEKIRELASKSSEKTRDLVSTIYLSGVDFADTKTATFIAGGACTVGGFKLLELPKSQDALARTAKFLESSKAGTYAFVCDRGGSSCKFLAKLANDTLSKVQTVSSEAAEFITQHKVGACVAGAAGAAAIGGGVYAYKKYKEGTAAAAASRRQLEETEQAKTLLEEAEQAKILLDFVDNFGGDHDGENFGRSPLVLAAESGNLPLVKLLIKAGADVNKQLSVGGHAGKDALFFAANWGRPEIVNVLLAAGANNFDIASQVAEGNKNVKADGGVEAAGTLVEYQAVINAIEEAKAKESK